MIEEISGNESDVEAFILSETPSTKDATHMAKWIGAHTWTSSCTKVLLGMAMFYRSFEDVGEEDARKNEEMAVALDKFAREFAVLEERQL